MLEKGIRGFSFFELSKVGIPIAIIGVLAISIIGHRLLPERKEPITELGEQTREFVVALKVEKKYPHIGQSVKNAGLRHLRGLFLFQIEREGKLKSPITPEEIIQLNDRLFFTGPLWRFSELPVCLLSGMRVLMLVTMIQIIWAPLKA
jgi:Trk K+ transport system NAD-binding subunit